MNARRSRNDSAQRFAEFRWWGCVLLALFAVVQAARGSLGPSAYSESIRSDSAQDPFASAASNPAPQVVAIDTDISVAAWREARKMPMPEIYGSRHLEINWR